MTAIWILVMVMTSANGTSVSAFPKPMTETQCQEAFKALEAKHAEAAQQDVKFEIKCLEWKP